MSVNDLGEKWSQKKNRLKFKKKLISEQCVSIIKIIKLQKSIYKKWRWF